jgi:regulator of RNase E activity RraA
MGRGRVMAYDVPIRCGEVLVHPGELIFADYDGIVVVPRQVEHQVLELAREKAGKESLTRQDLLKGRTLREVYDTYGVL